MKKHKTLKKEFKHLHPLVSAVIAREKMLFDYQRDESELRRFIRVNFKRGRTDVSKLRINKNNFTHIYRKWHESVYPFIDAPRGTLKRNYGIYDRDFYLAEINVDDKETYNRILVALKNAMKALARQIEQKVYAYGFLKR